MNGRSRTSNGQTFEYQNPSHGSVLDIEPIDAPAGTPSNQQILEDLRDWLAESSQNVCSNSIGSVELRRAAGRIGPEFSAAASRLLNRISIVALSAEAVDLAGALAGQQSDHRLARHQRL